MPRAFALVLCGIGAAIVVVALRLSARGRETRTWTRTQGRVVLSRLDEVPRPAEEGGPQFRPAIRYRYDARGGSYESAQVSVGSEAAPSTDREEAVRWLERFPAGREVDVWFDPGDPGNAVLVRGVPGAQIVTAIAIGIALAAIGFVLLARGATLPMRGR